MTFRPEFQETFDRYMAALPETCDREDARRIFTYCGETMTGGESWPNAAAIDELRKVSSGYGDWWADIMAVWDENEAHDSDFWYIALQGCKAMLFQIHVLEKQKRG